MTTSPPLPAGRGPNGPLTLLLLEPDGSSLTDMSTALEEAGLDVHCAQDVDEAHEILSSDVAVDLVLLNVALMGEGARSLVMRLVEKQGVPVVVFGQPADTAMQRQALELGALACMDTPSAVDDWPSAFNEILALVKARVLFQQKDRRLKDACWRERSVHAAVGILMMQYRVNRLQALMVLGHSALDRNLPMSEIASKLISHCDSLHTPGVSAMRRGVD